MTLKKLTCKETVELVTDYLEAALLPEMKAQLEAHLIGCPSCTNYLDQMQQTLHLLRQLTAETTPPATREQLLFKFREWQRSREKT